MDSIVRQSQNNLLLLKKVCRHWHSIDFFSQYVNLKTLILIFEYDKPYSFWIFDVNLRVFVLINPIRGASRMRAGQGIWNPRHKKRGIRPDILITIKINTKFGVHIIHRSNEMDIWNLSSANRDLTVKCWFSVPPIFGWRHRIEHLCLWPVQWRKNY